MNAGLAWVRRAVDLVYPRNCQVCSTPVPDRLDGVLCEGCRQQVRWIEPPYCQRCALPFDGTIHEPFTCGYCRDMEFAFERVVCACRAEGIVRECVHRFKYNRHMYFGAHLAEWLLTVARQQIDWETVDAIVPVPLHPRKKWERSFNQAEDLASVLGRQVGVPVLANRLRRVKNTPSQTRLGAESRAANLRNAFAMRRKTGWAGERLVLVDDVFTTGATMHNCAKVLLAAGSGPVTALAVARGV